MNPIAGVGNNSGAHHIQVHVNETTVQVLVSINRCRMIAVFLKCAVARFVIVFLFTASGDQLHATGDNVWTGISQQKVNVIARHDVIKNRKAEALLRFKKPEEIGAAIARTV